MGKKKKKNRLWDLIKDNFSKICLVTMFFMVLVYTAVVLWIFAHIGSEPSTLTISFFALMTGECGMLALIKNTKTKFGIDVDEKKKEEEKHQDAIGFHVEEEDDGEHHG